MKFNKLITNIIRTIAIAGLVLGVKGVTVKASDSVESERTINELKVDTKTDTLKSKNEDYRFWLKVENTKIDYPVVQSTDNSFYLSKDFNKKDSISGTPFLDYRNDSLNDKNTILYAHHMKNGTMFGDLMKFKNEEFFNQNNMVTIEIDGQIRNYEVFSVYVTEATTDYLKTQFLEGEFSNYLNTALEKSIYKKDIDVNSEDNIITFSTCSYEFKNARTVVHAKLVK